jgi:alpha-L-rhamnosidase
MRDLFCYIILFLGLAGRVEAQKAEGLTCEQRVSPLGIDVLHPRLGWRVVGVKQTAYQVIVTGSGGVERWNSGKVKSDQSWMVPYGGKPLKSRDICRWKVKVWTDAGESSWSEEALWTMGLLSPADWKGKWIGYDGGFPWDSVSKFSRLSARYFRKSFYLDKGVRRAILYIVGLGHYELRVNGVPVEKNMELAQAPTDYTKSVLYRTYEVHCRRGGNVIDVVLGNGRFFTMRPKYKPKKIKEFGFPKLLLQLELEDSSGGRRIVVSDTSWRFTADGPIRSNNEYDGEECDARKSLKDWMKPQVVASPGGQLRAQMNPGIGVLDVIRPQRLWKEDSVWMLDMGQNMAGWVRMKVTGPGGTVVRLRFGETLKADGGLYTANLRDAKATDVYTLKGEGVEDWRPSFVFHGFRYVEVRGYPGTPSVDDFTGEVIGDKMEGLGKIETSDELLNKILRNAWWGISANYKGMPVDCPQRNERMPWLGDRATGSLGESYFFDNGMLYAKWLDDIGESQKPDGQLPDVAPAYWNYYSDNMTWPGVYLMVADMLYRQYADMEPIRKHYASMKRWMNYMSTKYEVDGLMTKDKYGDWCVPPESPQLIHSKDPSRITDGVLIATAYYYHLLGLMGEFAGMLGKKEDSVVFGGKAEKVRTAFNSRFFDAAGGGYSNNTVTANLLPLCFGMVPEDKKIVVFKHITDKIDHISTGVIGTQWLMRGLTDNGRADLAYKLASNTDYPGWGYMVKQGATTIWELWNGNTADPAMNSQNHVMLLGDLITWCFEDLGGIAPGAPGFKKIRMKPVFPAGLNFVKASYRTPYGDVVSNWRREGGGISWDITVPFNSGAEVCLPDGKVLEVGSGNYHYDIK